MPDTLVAWKLDLDKAVADAKAMAAQMGGADPGTNPTFALALSMEQLTTALRQDQERLDALEQQLAALDQRLAGMARLGDPEPAAPVAVPAPVAPDPTPGVRVD